MGAICTTSKTCNAFDFGNHPCPLITTDLNVAERLCMDLLESAQTGDTGALQNLLNQDADINFRDRSGRTALHLACAEGHSDAVRFLISKGAILDVRDRWGRQPIQEAVAHRHKWVVDILMAAGAGLAEDWKSEMKAKFFHFAAKNNLVGIANLLDQGICIDSTDYLGKTALHIAVENGSRAVVDYLLSKGIDVNSADQAGNSPLLIAIATGDFAIQTALSAAGALPCPTPIHISIAKPRCDCDDSNSLCSRRLSFLCATISLLPPASPAAEAAARQRAFESIDALTAAHGVERFDIVGAVYAAATKLPPSGPAPDHAARMARFALAALGPAAAAAAAMGGATREAHVRIGIHCGAVRGCGAGASMRPGQRSWMGDGFKAAAALARAAGPGSVLCSAAAAALIEQGAPDVAVEYRQDPAAAAASAAAAAPVATIARRGAAHGPTTPPSRRAAGAGPDCDAAAAFRDLPGSPAPSGPEPAGGQWA